MLTRSRRNQPKDNAPNYDTPVRIVSVSVDLSVMTIEFNQPVVLKTLPQYVVDVVGADPVSAVVVDPLTIAITYSQSVALGTQITIEFQDPGVRSSTGGYVADSVYTFA